MDDDQHPSAPAHPRAVRAAPRRRGAAHGAARRPSALARFAPALFDGESPHEVAARDRVLRRLLAGADVAAALAVVGAVVQLSSDAVLRPAVLLVVPLVLVAGRLLGLYHRDEVVLSHTTLHEVPRLFQLATLVTLLLVLGQGAFLDGAIGAEHGFALWGGFLLATVGCRAAVRRLAVAEAAPERCLVLADDDALDRVREVLEGGAALDAQVVATVDPGGLPRGPGASAVLAEAVREHRVHRVVISTSRLDTDRLLMLVRDMKGLGVKVSIKPRLLEVVGTAVEFESVGGDVFLGVRRFGLGRTDRALKRGIDLAFSVLLLAGFAPLIALIALAVRLDSRGPVFFRQERVGRDGRRFRIWKFRTMAVDAEARKAELRDRGGSAGLFKLADDPRVTRVGRRLRRTSLDELPQLLNVLRGEMSLVGPRPLVLDEDTQVEGWHRRRLHLTPGMTGIWQVMGSRLPLHEMVALDYLYIVDWSVWKDLQILLRTIGFVVSRRGM